MIRRQLKNYPVGAKAVQQLFQLSSGCGIGGCFWKEGKLIAGQAFPCSISSANE